MDAKGACKPTIRRLHPWEMEAARLVFGNGLKYDAVRIHECTTWTDALDRLGRRLKGMPPLENVHNAVTLCNHCYFPIRLPDQPTGPGDLEHYKIAWLIHELTHAWQFQQMGWGYLLKALGAQFRGKASAYDFGSEAGLVERRKAGAKFRSFNLEQQGDIARSYYERACRNQDVTAWTPFIEELQDPQKRTV